MNPQVASRERVVENARRIEDDPNERRGAEYRIREPSALLTGRDVDEAILIPEKNPD